RRSRKERCGVPIESHAEQENVEARWQLAFVLPRRGIDVAHLSRHAEDLRARNGDVAEEHVVRHVKVAFGMVRRDTALITEVGIYLAPGNWRRVPRQSRVDRTRRVAAGQRNCA